ncbi:MAG: HD domain-containing protein [Saprospiraceae bacterium]|jgi:phosphonate degradation associated HDIG domain protein|nr:HD domain-containing protein [Saprospiraceae bacterium]
MEAHIQKANELITLFQSQGNALYFGEHVTQLQHAIQCALIASSEGSDAETILAAFLHDIGHLHPDGALVETMDQYGVADHEQLGAEYLREMGFSEKVCTLVRSHVEAKRYLTFKFPEYYENLSDASKQTLLYQGGKMTSKEAKKFELTPWKEECIQLRFWDEQAKSENSADEDLTDIRNLMIEHLSTNATKR